MPISRPFKNCLARVGARQRAANVLSHTGLGGNDLLIIAGPCAVESRTQLLVDSQAVREAGAHALRGGAFKTAHLALCLSRIGGERAGDSGEARELTGLPVVTEVMTPKR
jgi:3-deoxy-7-phosphoheptulonate synthase